jgi:hypothetical protein
VTRRVLVVAECEVRVPDGVADELVIEAVRTGLAAPEGGLKYICFDMVDNSLTIQYTEHTECNYSDRRDKCAQHHMGRRNWRCRSGRQWLIS